MINDLTDNSENNEAYAFFKKGTLKYHENDTRNVTLLGVRSKGIYAFVSCPLNEDYHKVDLAHLVNFGVSFDNDHFNRGAVSSSFAQDYVMNFADQVERTDYDTPLSVIKDGLLTIERFFT